MAVVTTCEKSAVRLVPYPVKNNQGAGNILRCFWGNFLETGSNFCDSVDRSGLGYIL